MPDIGTNCGRYHRYLLGFYLLGLSRAHFSPNSKLDYIAGQWSCEKIVILSLKPRGHVRILIHRKWAIIMSWTILKGLLLSNLDLPQVDSVSAEGARDTREASECDRQQNRKRALRKSISNVACSHGSCRKDS